ncbi:unnamed protein product [Closterium sp. NIES-53]
MEKESENLLPAGTLPNRNTAAGAWPETQASVSAIAAAGPGATGVPSPLVPPSAAEPALPPNCQCAAFAAAAAAPVAVTAAPAASPAAAAGTPAALLAAAEADTDSIARSLSGVDSRPSSPPPPSPPPPPPPPPPPRPASTARAVGSNAEETDEFEESESP